MSLTPAQMDSRIDEHFGFEAADNVEGVLSTLESAIPAPLAGVLDWLPMNATGSHAAAFDALFARLASLVSASGG